MHVLDRLSSQQMSWMAILAMGLTDAAYAYMPGKTLPPLLVYSNECNCIADLA